MTRTAAMPSGTGLVGRSCLGPGGGGRPAVGSGSFMDSDDN